MSFMAAMGNRMSKKRAEVPSINETALERDIEAAQKQRLQEMTYKRYLSVNRNTARFRMPCTGKI
jgi:hypothetical protein